RAPRPGAPGRQRRRTGRVAAPDRVAVDRHAAAHSTRGVHLRSAHYPLAPPAVVCGALSAGLADRVAAFTRIGCLVAHASPAPSPAAQRELIEVALAYSPRVEDGGPGLVYLDVAGLSGLWGSEDEIARRLVSAAADRGLRARVGIAGSRIGALCACRKGAG